MYYVQENYLITDDVRFPAIVLALEDLQPL